MMISVIRTIIDLVVEMETTRKRSKKREAILQALRSTKEHPSAEMIYNRLKPDYPDLSLGTVYRNLSVFVADGDAISVGTVDGQERYDSDMSAHAHFICTCCGRVFDVSSPVLDDLNHAVEQETGGRVMTRSLSFRGECSSCITQAETAV